MVKILLIDDEQDILFLLSGFLRNHGYDISTADTLAKARDLLLQSPTPDVLLLDLNLPDGYGLNLLKEQMDVLEKTRIIVISAFSAELTEDEIKENRISAVFSKPFDFNQILTLLKEEELP